MPGTCLYSCIFFHSPQHWEYISVCACVCRDVFVMFHNDRFTPSRDSTYVHMLRLLSPFPLRLSHILLFNLLGTSRWQALWRCEHVCVCLPLTLVTHILSGVTHMDWAEIEMGVKRLCACWCVSDALDCKYMKTQAFFLGCVHSYVQQVSVYKRLCAFQISWLSHFPVLTF